MWYTSDKLNTYRPNHSQWRGDTRNTWNGLGTQASDVPAGILPAGQHRRNDSLRSGSFKAQERRLFRSDSPRHAPRKPYAERGRPMNKHGTPLGHLTHWNQDDGGCTLQIHIPSTGNLRLDFEPPEAAALSRELRQPTGSIVPLPHGSLRILRNQSQYEFVLDLERFAHPMSMNIPEWLVQRLLDSLP